MEYEIQIGEVIMGTNPPIKEPKEKIRISEETYQLLERLCNIRIDANMEKIYKINDIEFKIALYFKNPLYEGEGWPIIWPKSPLENIKKETKIMQGISPPALDAELLDFSKLIYSDSLKSRLGEMDMNKDKEGVTVNISEIGGGEIKTPKVSKVTIGGQEFYPLDFLLSLNTAVPKYTKKLLERDITKKPSNKKNSRKRSSKFPTKK